MQDTGSEISGWKPFTLRMGGVVRCI